MIDRCRTALPQLAFILGSTYRSVFAQAKKRGGAEYRLTERQEITIARRSKDKCEVTGIPFSLDKNGYSKAPFAPSVDRIDSLKGYSTNNTRLVCMCVNYAMNEWGEWVLAPIAYAIAGKKLQSLIEMAPEMAETTTKEL